MNFTITRYERPGTWQAAIMPDNRAWILYVTAEGNPWLYIRAEDVTDESGDTRERYVLDDGAASRSGRAEVTIRVTRASDDGSVHPFRAFSGAYAGMGQSEADAVRDLLACGKDRIWTPIASTA